MIDLNEAASKAREISIKRSRNGAKVNQDLLQHAAGELVEAVSARGEYFSALKNDREVIVTERLYKYAEELADVIICIMIQADFTGINIEQAIIDKMEKNRLRAEKQGDKL